MFKILTYSCVFFNEKYIHLIHLLLKSYKIFGHFFLLHFFVSQKIRKNCSALCDLRYHRYFKYFSPSVLLGKKR